MATKVKVEGAQYVRKERRSYFIYTMESRSIPHIADGLKASGRRLLWVAKDGSKNKTATLAGAAMPYHPHDQPDDVASLMASPYLNNICLFEGIGAFGTLLDPKSYGAPRYTSIKVSDFTKQVVFADLEIIPLKRNYDDTLDEPKHFLPLVPIVLLNPNFGINGGFKCNILPRSLEDIVMSQIEHLEGSKSLQDKFPRFTPITCTAFNREINEESGNVRWYFGGEYEEINGSEVWITKLPYGTAHSEVITHLNELEDSFEVMEFDDFSKDVIRIHVRLPRGEVKKLSTDELKTKLGLINSEVELMNVIDFDGTSVLPTTYSDVVTRFTDWRLKWYVTRYERLLRLLLDEIQRYKDVLKAIEKNVGGMAKKIANRQELIEFLVGISIVHVDYIAALPVYRFTEEEKVKTEQKLHEALLLQKEYEDLLSSEQKRRKVYVCELKQILKNFGGR